MGMNGTLSTSGGDCLAPRLNIRFKANRVHLINFCGILSETNRQEDCKWRES